jgi:hypothetical protein
VEIRLQTEQPHSILIVMTVDPEDQDHCGTDFPEEGKREMCRCCCSVVEIKVSLIYVLLQSVVLDSETICDANYEKSHPQQHY